VYLGKINNPETNQLEIIQKLKQRNPKIAIAINVPAPLSGVLDRYLAGR